MKAILVSQPGGVEQLHLGEYEKPQMTDSELLVRVKATALNRADLLQREGKYPPPQGASPILGLEMAGVVEEVGEMCKGKWRPGDRVFGLLPGGGYAEYAVIADEMAMKIPEPFTFEQAAAIPEAFLTAYQTLFWVGHLQKGETVLIHAGASGVGTAAIQLVKAIGAQSIVTVGSETKGQVCLQLGATHAINYKEGPFLDKIMELTNGIGVNLILDFVGASYWEQNINSLRQDGRLVLISLLGGSRMESVSLSKLLAKRIQVTGTTLRSRSVAYKTKLTQEFASFALPLFLSGKLQPVIDRVFPWEQVQQAHQYMEENRNIGKIVLRVH